MRHFRLLALLLPVWAAPAASQSEPPPLAVANPNYVTIVLEQDVDRPAPEVWSRVGRFCDIAEWMAASCTITVGDAWSLGSVRLIRGTIVEMMVAKTALSYTYTQPVRNGVPFNAYHGTLEVRPTSARTSRLVYSFFYDNSMLADEKARQEELAGRRTRFQNALSAMKAIAEGSGARR